jgi:hypothetical protein
MESENYFTKYGDRTSSLVSLYPHFSSFKDSKNEGEIRYSIKNGVVGLANEPLTPEGNKLKIINHFCKNEEFKSKDKLIFPISKQLATTLNQNGFYVWQIGVEPIFNLHEYFSGHIDPLYNVPIAKSLKRRGAKVFELSAEELDKFRDEAEELKKEWLSQKKMAPLEFLNVIDPFSYESYKRFFILKDKEKMAALLTATPIYSEDQVIGYFFNDILRRKNSRSGSAELLIIEAMRMLYQDGILEVRLGACPLAEISSGERNSKELTRIFDKWKWGYNFKSLYQFKMKLGPTSMRPLYLATDRPELGRMLKNVFKLHVSRGFFKIFLLRSWYAYRQNLKLKKSVTSYTLLGKNKELTLAFRLKWTISLFVFFVSIHLLKNTTQVGSRIYDLSAYIPGKVSTLGLWLGPLFHNHSLHLVGDQLSFLVFAGALEYVFGASFILLITAVGLWLSNPMTHFLLAMTLKFTSTYWWQQVLAEKDYGTSNAVFALVGASVFVLKKNSWLLIPFLFHAFFVCIQRESFLAIHHLVGIFLGYVVASLYFVKSASFHPERNLNET